MSSEKQKFKLRDNLKDKFIAYIDVLGFSGLVNNNSVENLDSYFSKITDELDDIRGGSIKIESFLISDSIILIAPSGLNGLKQLLRIIRRIQSALLWRKMLVRGAVSFGQVFYNRENNIIVGKGFVRAYLLEKEAIFPRIIIDPAILKQMDNDRIGFLTSVNGGLEYKFEERLVYAKSKFCLIGDDAIFIDYANKTVKKTEINGNANIIYKTIQENLYSDQRLYFKYVWLRDYFLETFRLTASLTKDESKEAKIHRRNLENWLSKFERL